MLSTLLITLLLQAVAIPKINPSGTWESLSGTQFQIRLTGSDVAVRMVPGSNPRYTKYEVDLKNSPDEKNSYQGKGFFVAKKDDKECRFETQWTMYVVAENQIVGISTNIVPDWATCTSTATGDAELNLKKNNSP